jgi:hypothetical protein
MKRFIILSSLTLFISFSSFGQESEAVIIRKLEMPLGGGPSGTTDRVIGMPLGAGSSGTTSIVINMPLGAGTSGTTARILNIPLGAGPSGTTDRVIGMPVGAGPSGTTSKMVVYEIEDVNTGELIESYPTDLDFFPGEHVMYVK